MAAPGVGGIHPSPYLGTLAKSLPSQPGVKASLSGSPEAVFLGKYTEDTFVPLHHLFKTVHGAKGPEVPLSWGLHLPRGLLDIGGATTMKRIGVPNFKHEFKFKKQRNGEELCSELNDVPPPPKKKMGIWSSRGNLGT